MNHTIVIHLDNNSETSKKRLKHIDDSISVPWSLFPAVVGSNMTEFEGVDRSVFHHHFVEEVKERKLYGHIGATLSHLGVWHDISYNDYGPTLVLEDDAILGKGWQKKLIKIISKLPSDWDILLLGWACPYNATDRCRLNDGLKVKDGFVKPKKFIGLWAYMVNGRRAADKILKDILPLNWIVDHEISRLIHMNDLQVYGCVPNIIYHPGSYTIDSFGEKYNVRPDMYSSNTNN